MSSYMCKNGTGVKSSTIFACTNNYLLILVQMFLIFFVADTLNTCYNAKTSIQNSKVSICTIPLSASDFKAILPMNFNFDEQFTEYYGILLVGMFCSFLFAYLYTRKARKNGE